MSDSSSAKPLFNNGKDVIEFKVLAASLHGNTARPTSLKVRVTSSDTRERRGEQIFKKKERQDEQRCNKRERYKVNKEVQPKGSFKKSPKKSIRLHGNN